ncbi:aminoglycoside phosphotransferase [Roseibium denhamense]|uniref:Aminoglycoside phosphotransferase domain-containing protein n=1 Tax=Roseibium denhamense TaxID=76305 RepID=A0ABY1P383_9HYPH|nr:bifunctional aminoglycoside phosphotransferase/ATP-binding protein [Roseibium denhamense]MTI07616.1 aminoglycoside phosphotransferase [Roseibium denhamense]SMP24145.1 hypothetical protein SAMN06265374_2382 [Roseibium denhamense]
MAHASDQTEALNFLNALPARDPARPDVMRIDTHANVVFLAGALAYKVKRAVTFPFLDYSTLALRKAACEAEITVNQPNAPQIYRRAIPITREEDGRLALNGQGTPVEWTVEMNRFHRTDELDMMAADALFPDTLSNDLAAMMVTAHDGAPLRNGAGFFAELESYVEQNEAAFREFPELFASEDVRHLTETARTVLASLKALILKRGETGLVRRCHGDAHLRNIVLLEGKPVLFDAVEFSDAIATGDVLYDLAFLLMDLWERGQPRAANRVFNRYLDQSRLEHGTDGLAALPFYLMMRAAIRAKIAASAAANQTDPDERQRQEDQARAYFGYACRFLEPSRPDLLAIGGLSGTGKTTLAYSLAPDLGRAPGARVLRTDVMRKRLYGLTETEKAPEAAYTKEASAKVYEALDSGIQNVLAAGHSAIYDAVFADPAEREKIEAVAHAVEAAFTGLWLEAPPDTLRTRVEARSGDASDATAHVVDTQLTYDLGRLTWARIDAGNGPEETANRARSVLKLS